MHIHLCGVRGSIPTAGEAYLRIGGNTSCIALRHDGDEHPSLILDAGSGLRRLSQMMGKVPFRGTLVLTHLHWDHVIGLPFFPAGDQPDARVRAMMPDQGTDAQALITVMMSPPFFPITPAQLRGQWSWENYEAGTFEAEGFTITTLDIPHKGGRTMGIRVSDGHSSMAYFPDHAPTDIGPGDDGVGVLHETALALADGVDVLIHDSQYTADEFPMRSTWGHSTPMYAMSLGKACNVGRLLLFHHDPSRTDDQAEAIFGALPIPDGLRVDLAIEGTVISV